jgi:predicted phage-related endonuclease
MSGASPDGLIGTEGLVEIKCPNTATHIETLLADSVPAKYVTQMQWQMACTGRIWCDFVSYDPRLPEHMRFFSKHLSRDGERIKELEQLVTDFLTELDEKIFRLSQRYAIAAE